MGATLGGRESHGLIARHADPDDGRRILLSLTEAGRRALRNRRSARVKQLAEGLRGLKRSELDQLIAAAPLIEGLAWRL
jgi:DNA-binding MarR family transcriptional regulator